MGHSWHKISQIFIANKSVSFRVTFQNAIHQWSRWVIFLISSLVEFKLSSLLSIGFISCSGLCAGGFRRFFPLSSFVTTFRVPFLAFSFCALSFSSWLVLISNYSSVKLTLGNVQTCACSEGVVRTCACFEGVVRTCACSEGVRVCLNIFN